jgi:hypothetical protein
MASFFSSSAAAPPPTMSPGVEKALAFLILAMIGRLLKPRFSQPQLAGVQRLIMDATLPCTIFKALCAVSLDYELLRWPLLGIAFVVVQLAAAAIASKLFFPDTIRRNTALYQLATAAPGLSAFVFIKEFVGAQYAGPAALFDLPYKLYLVLVLPFLLGVPAPSATKLVTDPLNLSIISGLLVAATRTPYASLGALGQAASLLASAQTPILFVLIGAKVKLTGATPLVCLSLLMLRHAACYVYVSLVAFGTDAERMTLLLLAQAAVSVVGWGQIARAKENGGSYDVDLAFDVVGYSMPLTMALQTAACLGVLPSLTVMPLICLALSGVGWALLRRRPGANDALAKVA